MTEPKQKPRAKITLRWEPGSPHARRPDALQTPTTLPPISESAETLHSPLYFTADGEPVARASARDGQTDVMHTGAPWQPLQVIEPVPPTEPMHPSPGEARAPAMSAQDGASMQPAALSSPPPPRPRRLRTAAISTALVGLAGVVFVGVFFVVDRSWMTPIHVSPTDPRAMELEGQRETLRAGRSAAAAQRSQLQANLDDEKRVAAVEAEFQTSFEELLKLAVASHDADVDDERRLLGDLQRTRAELRATTATIPQTGEANLALQEKHVEIEARIAQLEKMMATLHSGKGASYELLHTKHEYERSKLASQKAQGDVSSLTRSIATFDQTIATYDAQLKVIEGSPYLAARDGAAPMAFVPYDNVPGMAAGDEVYACSLGVVGCRPVGKVAAILDGEIVEPHPLRGGELRGKLARLTLDDPSAMQAPLLHLRHAPFGL